MATLSTSSSSSSAHGLKSLMKKHILDNVIRSINNKEKEKDPNGSAKYKILVLDKETLRLVNSAVKMSELTDENITLVEPLEKRRQPYVSLPAIYFVSPTSDSVTRIIEDFTRNKYNRDGRLYASAHLFFTSTLDDRLMHRIKTSTAHHFIETLSEVYTEFNAFESQVFTLDRSHALLSFFGTEVTGEQITKEFAIVARRLASFFITLGEFPHIRYSTANNFDRITSKIAGFVYDELDRYCRLDPSFPTNDPALLGPNRCQLIICDRTIDTMAPFLHEFTYQAMANDLLPLTDNGSRYKYTYVSTTEGKREKEVILDETMDPLWISIRHSHIAECINSLLTSFNKFLNDNRAATGISNKKGVTSLSELKETLSAVPQFQEMKAKFSVHINITQECMNIFNTRKLNLVAAVEQDMATGETAEGEVPKRIESDLIPLLDDPNVALYDKVRLLMLYIISKEGLKDEDRRKLFEHAQIGTELSTAITNLTLLGVKLTYSKQKKSSKSSKKQKKRDDDVPYELSRYQPVVKKIMTEACDGSLSKDIFPYAKDPNTFGFYGDANLSKSSSMRAQSAGTSSPAITPITATSLRSTKPSWHTKAIGSDTSAMLSNEKKEEERKKGGRVVVFVVGGMTHSEMRSAYDVGAAMKKDVIVGSTHIITPAQMIDDIKNLRLPLTLPEDAANAKANAAAMDSTKMSLNNLAGDKKRGMGIKGFFKGLKKTKDDSADNRK